MALFMYVMLWVSGGLFLVSGALCAFELIRPRRIIGRFPALFTIAGLIAVTVMIIGRTIAAHRIPLTNMFEFGLLFLACAVLAYLLIYFKYKLRTLGVIILPMVTIMNFWLLTLDKDIRPLMPVLNSNWLYFHVFTAIASYGCFMVSFAVAVLYLIKARQVKQTGASISSLDPLDELTYKIICIGMPFLTLCIVTGAFWAEKAWGSYWSWDPKETWSLVTWLIYAGYLHARLMAGWRGKKAIYLAVAGFLAVIFTFLGVNLLLPGLHSYAS